MPSLPSGITKTARYYRVRVTVDGTRHLVGDYHTLRDARNALDVARGEIAKGTFVPRATRRAQAKAEKERAKRLVAQEIESATTLEQWSRRWLEQLGQAGRSEGTIVSYRSTLRAHILPALGERSLASVTQDDVDGLLKSCRSGGASRNTARTLRAMYAAAVKAKAGGLTSMPFVVSVPKASSSGMLDSSKIASPQQVRALCEAMPPRLALAPMLAAVMSLRLGEVLGLQRRDFDGLGIPGGVTLTVARQWNSKTVGGQSYTPPKAGSAGVLAVPDFLAPLIVEHLEAWVAPDPVSPIFTAQRDPSRPISQTSFDKAWRAAREVAGMPGYRFHDLRHTGLTMYAQAGATLAEIMARGRHKHPEVAVRYQHATLERDRANAQALGRAFGG